MMAQGLTNPFLLFNAQTQKKEEFVRRDNSRPVGVYCCGPTVYDVPHLGHARTCIFFDLLCRYLRNRIHLDVMSVMNITDMDDKVILKGGPLIARKYEKIFFETMDLLNNIRPDFTPRASEYHIQAEEYVRILREKGYVLADNRFATHLYLKNFKVAFSNNEKREIPKEGFSVWKSKKDNDLEGVPDNGKPGWHMECATMNAYFFGNNVDIHVGGIDLQFPHHENEIALGRVLFNKSDWIRFMLHTGHLEIEGRKMSKSEKNFITVQEMLDKNYSPLAIRYLFMKHPYGTPMHFKEEELKKAQNSYDQFILHLENLKEFLAEGEEELQKPDWYSLYQFKRRLDECLMDNLNIPVALQVLENYVKIILPKVKNKEYLRYCLNFVIEVTDKWFGLIPRDTMERFDSLVPIIKKFRSQVREVALKQLSLCDELRKTLNEKKFITEDKM